MSLSEKRKMLGGYKEFYTQKLIRFGIRRILMVDGTQGIHIRYFLRRRSRIRKIKKSICYPAPILLSATWNTDVAKQYAYAIGLECKSSGVGILLGPGLNIYRSSTCGRNFEYFGEDPYLVGEMIHSYVKGIQETNVLATLKHFIANNSEYARRKSNSIVDERALHEIYMPAFKRGIDAGALLVMTSYNLVNGEKAGQSEYVINQLLYKQLGFKGLVMTDWVSIDDDLKFFSSDQGLEMPYGGVSGNMKKLLFDRKINIESIDQKIKRQLQTFIFAGAYKKSYKKLSKKDYKKLEETSLNTAREGIVLLKNNGILPLNPTKHKEILLTGQFVNTLARGGGAAYVEGYNIITLYSALKEYEIPVYFSESPSESRIKSSDIVIVSLGTSDKETEDRRFELPDYQQIYLSKCIGNNPNTIVLVNAGGGVEMESLYNKVSAILFGWYWGQNGAIALAEILYGKVSPSAKLPITIERKFSDSPSYKTLPKGHDPYVQYDEKKEEELDVFDVHYSEGIFVGYRWYNKNNIEPLFPFGFGLSYTSFRIFECKMDKNTFTGNDRVVISLKVENTGKRKGAEVVQLYVSDIHSSIERPIRELKKFKKTFLLPGEVKDINFNISSEDFMFWSPKIKNWLIEPGIFEIQLGNSSSNIFCSLKLEYA